MPPQSEEPQSPPHYSSLGIKYPEHRDEALHTAESWLEDKRADDGAEGLWRVYDELYDLTNWIDKHPGGSDWLKWTKGTDITEAFESHHITLKAEGILPKYHVRKAVTVRNSPYTFHNDGFYKVLKGRVREIMKTVPEHPKNFTKIMTDLLFLGYVLCAVVSVLFSTIWISLLIGVLAGVFLGLLTIAAHNYIHQADNFRMYYFYFSMMSAREFRIIHSLSHHMYTNTIKDLEIASLEPFILYLPEEKHIFRRIISFVISPGFYTFLFISGFIKRLLAQLSGKPTQITEAELLPFTVPLVMCICGTECILYSLGLWFWILCVGSFHFGLVGLNAAHHHPNIFHDGDTPRVDRDWGLAEMDTVMDRREINISTFLVLTNFGDHALHHLFPTVDHGHLAYLYPVLLQTCSEFGIKFRVTSQLNLIVGQFLQIFRVRPNPNPPGTKRKKKNTPKPLAQRLKPYINKDKIEETVEKY